MALKLYRNLTEAVVNALHEIFAEKRYADKVIEKVLKQNPKWGARDRRFIAETTYDIVRWYRLLRMVTEAKGDDYWKLLAGWCIVHNIDLPAWSEFKDVSVQKVGAEIRQAEKSRKV